MHHKPVTCTAHNIASTSGQCWWRSQQKQFMKTGEASCITNLHPHSTQHSINIRPALVAQPAEAIHEDRSGLMHHKAATRTAHNIAPTSGQRWWRSQQKQSIKTGEEQLRMLSHGGRGPI
jgi:hypothetical protein